jgi:hypothetical protein
LVADPVGAFDRLGAEGAEVRLVGLVLGVLGALGGGPPVDGYDPRLGALCFEAFGLFGHHPGVQADASRWGMSYPIAAAWWAWSATRTEWWSTT